MHLQHPVSEECEWVAQPSSLRPVVHLTDRQGRNRTSGVMSRDEAARLRDSLTAAIDTIDAREAEWKALARSVTT